MRIIKETVHRVLVEQIASSYWSKEWAIYEKENDGKIGMLEFHTSNKELAEQVWQDKIGTPRWRDSEKYKELCTSTKRLALEWD